MSTTASTTPPRLRLCMAMLATNGGSSIVARELGHGLGAHGFDVKYCHLRPDQQQADDFILQATPGMHSSSLLDVPASLGGSMDAASELLRIADAWPFDVLHVHNLQVYGLPALMLKQLRGVPYVVTCHGSDILNPHLLDQNYEVAAAVLHGAAAVSCVSQHLQETVRSKFPGLPALHTITNFVRTAWRNLPPPAPAPGQLLLHVSSLRAVKRPELLLHAFSLLQQTCPGVCLQIVTTGDGVQRLHALLAAGMHNGDGLQIHNGEDDPGQLARAYRQAHALILSSRFEGFGLVVLEALQHGLPVVAPRVGALPEILGESWPFLVPELAGQQMAPALAGAMANALASRPAGLEEHMQAILTRYQGQQQIADYASLLRYAHTSTRTSIHASPHNSLHPGPACHAF